VALVAVSKTVGEDAIEAAIRLGITDFGENRAAALKTRQQKFAQQRWHFIGRIQTNKLKDYVGKVKLIHSVASEHALSAIDRRATTLALVQPVLIEVNVSGEQSKDGIAPKELAPLLEAAVSMTGVAVRGLMTMAPLTAALLDSADRGAGRSADDARRCFADLKELRDETAASFTGAHAIELSELSMGMSNDFELAVAEGATIVRIGRRLWE
jgi:pyridoxal phosphate enzyme (YggS family)